MSLQIVLQYLPQSEGWLPKWLLLVVAMAAFNVIQNFYTLAITRQLYSRASVTSLQARTFAAWTLATLLVRVYAAYNINDKSLYDMALFTFLIAFSHFVSELLIFRTARVTVAFASPTIVATTSLVWMLSQYSFYVKTDKPGS